MVARIGWQGMERHMAAMVQARGSRVSGRVGVGLGLGLDHLLNDELWVVCPGRWVGGWVPGGEVPLTLV